MDDDEFAAGGFTVSDAKNIHAPVVSEAFLTLECTLKEIQDLSCSISLWRKLMHKGMS